LIKKLIAVVAISLGSRNCGFKLKQVAPRGANDTWQWTMIAKDAMRCQEKT
jgi:hypothetical protein